MFTELFFFPFLALVISGLLVFVSSVLFMVAAISLPQHFSVLTLCRCFDASIRSSILVSLLSSSFCNTYSLSTLSLECKVLCVVISFLNLWPICLSSSLVHFKNDPEYLMKGTTLVFIPLISFLLYSFVLSSFLVLLRYSFFIFSFISACLIVSASNIPKDW